MVDEINYQEVCYGLLEDNRILMEWLRIAIKNIDDPDDSEILKVKKAYQAYFKMMNGETNEQ